MIEKGLFRRYQARHGQPQRFDDGGRAGQDSARAVRGVKELVFVRDRGMVKSPCKEALSAAGVRYITALTDPPLRRLLSQGTM